MVELQLPKLEVAGSNPVSRSIPKPVNHLMKNLILFLFALIGVSAFGQKAGVGPLFSSEEPLEIKLRFSVKDVKKITVDTIYTASVMQFKVGGKWDSIPMDIRARGNFRRENCYFPPLRIKISKNAAKGTIFEGNRSLKLVFPCKSAKDGNLVLREYVCYKMYEPVTKYIFNTRRVSIDFTDVSNKKMQHVPVIGFLIEDDDVVAKRHDGEVVEAKISPMRLQDTASVRHDFFQYLIANTDWSTTFLHNAKVMKLKNNNLIPLAYDFDMAGMVDAPYASVSETLTITSVTERLYRGFCRQPEIMQAVRKEYIAKEGALHQVLKQYEPVFDAKEFKGMSDFTNQFYAVLKDDGRFKAEILDKCRTK